MSSTPDTVFASHRLANAMMCCNIHTVDHGSDHKAIVLETSTLLDNYEERERKRLYFNADWEAIRATFKQHLATRYTWTSVETKHQLDQAAEELVALMNTTLKEMVPRAKPSPYAKRWWTKELSQLRQQLTVLRNQVTTLRRRGQDITHARLLVHQARKLYFNKMDWQKATHWKEFLDEANNI
jgi:regulator of sirC expression with transglutaminase-like and TPR domain